MIETPERILTFERCVNFRDLGGYAGLDGRPVRWRHLFRSMTPEHMTEADAEAVAALDIAFVFDFRGERFDTSGPVLKPGGVRLALAPQRNEAEAERFRALSPQEALPRVLDGHGPNYAHALATMAANPDANALFHCRLGKDRTGVFAALVLKLLGVSDDDVIQDYMLTAGLDLQVRALLEEIAGDTHTGARIADEPPDPVAMRNVLQHLFSSYGGAYGYFAHHGIASTLLDTFVEACLEPPPVYTLAQPPPQPEQLAAP